MRDGWEGGFPGGKLVSDRPKGNAQTFLAPAEVDEMLALYASGEPAARVAERFGVVRSTVHAHARRRGLAPRFRAVPDEAVGLYAAGVPARGLAERFGVSVWAVRRRVKAAGVQAPAKQVPAEMVDAMVEMYRAGAGVADVAGRFKVGVKAARRLLEGAGAEIRRGGVAPRVAPHAVEIAGLRREGWSYRRIAERIGVTPAAVGGFCRAHCLV
jgi:transposase